MVTGTATGRYNILNMLADYQIHLREDHGRYGDYGDNVARFHHQKFPNCEEVPKFTNYEFMGPLCIEDTQ